MLKLSKFDPDNPSTVRMAPGNFSFSAEIVDTWGAKAFYLISARTEFTHPTNDERIAFEESGVKDEIMVSVTGVIVLTELPHTGQWRLQGPHVDTGCRVRHIWPGRTNTEE